MRLIVLTRYAGLVRRCHETAARIPILFRSSRITRCFGSGASSASATSLRVVRLEGGPGGQSSKYTTTWADLKKEAGVHGRDMIQLLQKSTLPQFAILPRKNSLLLRLGRIRAVIFSDHCYFLDADERNVPRVLQRIAAAMVEPDELPFEHVVLEECIRETHEKYSRRVYYVRPLVQRLLRRLSHSDAEDLAQSLYQLYPLKSTLSHFVTMNSSLLNAVNSVMQDDRDMVDACLTARAAAAAHALDPPSEELSLSQPDASSSKAMERGDLERLELLLEVYHSRITESLQASEELLRNVDGKRELMQLQMSAYRNYLIHKELQLSIAGVTVAIPTFIVGAFGMNLTSGLEDTMNVFWPMTALSLVAGGLAYRLMANAITASSPTVRQYQRLQEFIIGIDGQVQSAASVLRQLQSGTPGLGDGETAVLGEGMRLKPQQFKELYAVVNGRAPSDSEVALLYDMFDADADGALELDEALSLLQDGQVPSSDR